MKTGVYMFAIGLVMAGLLAMSGIWKVDVTTVPAITAMVPAVWLY